MIQYIYLQRFLTIFFCGVFGRARRYLDWSVLQICAIFISCFVVLTWVLLCCVALRCIVSRSVVLCLLCCIVLWSVVLYNFAIRCIVLRLHAAAIHCVVSAVLHCVVIRCVVLLTSSAFLVFRLCWSCTSRQTQPTLLTGRQSLHQRTSQTNSTTLSKFDKLINLHLL